MSRHDDDLDGWELLSDRQRAVVARMQGQTSRYQRDRRELTNAEQWADFAGLELEDEANQVWRGGNR